MPVEGALAAPAFLAGAEQIGAVAPHPALVGEAGEAAGPGEDAEQGQFGQAHHRTPVVDQHDPV